MTIPFRPADSGQGPDLHRAMDDQQWFSYQEFLAGLLSEAESELTESMEPRVVRRFVERFIRWSELARASLVHRGKYSHADGVAELISWFKSVANRPS